MNKQKELQQTAASVDGYLAPSVRVHEIKTRKVLCASDTELNSNGIQQYGDGDTSGWY